jgi:hypothetical protein
VTAISPKQIHPPRWRKSKRMSVHARCLYDEIHDALARDVEEARLQERANEIPEQHYRGPQAHFVFETLATDDDKRSRRRDSYREAFQ